MTMTFDRVCLRCGSGEFITDRAPRPTPSTPGAPVEGRDDVDAVVPAEVDGLVGQLREKAAESGGYTGALCDAAAREIRRLRSALAEAQRDGANIVACPECGCEFDGDADAARSPREDATTSTTEG
jgi:hypothetical protein